MIIWKNRMSASAMKFFKYLNQNLVSPGKILLKEGSSDLRVEWQQIFTERDNCQAIVFFLHYSRVNCSVPVGVPEAAIGYNKLSPSFLLLVSECNMLFRGTFLLIQKFCWQRILNAKNNRLQISLWQAFTILCHATASHVLKVWPSSQRFECDFGRQAMPAFSG